MTKKQFEELFGVLERIAVALEKSNEDVEEAYQRAKEHVKTVAENLSKEITEEIINGDSKATPVGIMSMTESDATVPAPPAPVADQNAAPAASDSPEPITGTDSAESPQGLVLDVVTMQEKLGEFYLAHGEDRTHIDAALKNAGGASLAEIDPSKFASILEELNAVTIQ